MAFALVTLLASMHAHAGRFDYMHPPPVQDEPIAIYFGESGPSKWSGLPLGGYIVPNSDVILSGHQKGENAAVFFGIIGLGISGSINEGRGKESVNEFEESLRISLAKEARSIIEKLISDEQFSSKFTTAPSPNRPQLEISGAVALTRHFDGNAGVFVILKVDMMSKTSRDRIWTTRYMASTSPVRPITGDGGWFAEDSTKFRNAVRQDLEVTLRTMMQDISAPFDRESGEMTFVQGHFPYFKDHFQTKGFKLFENSDRLILLPRVADTIPLSGVVILDKGSYIHRPAVKSDPTLKIAR
jgi:hypothetical protein